MKIVACSDGHLDWVSMGVSRFGEVARGLHRAANVAIVGEADLFCFLGDLCNPDSGPSVFRAMTEAVAVAEKLAEAGLDSVWIAGNHDVVEDGSGYTTLSPLRALRATVIEGPRVIRVGAHDEWLEVVALPYTASSHPYDPGAFLDGLSEPSGRSLVLSHLVLPGIQPGEETDDLPRGREVLFPHDRFAVGGRWRGATLLSGHYHRQQTFDPRPGVLKPVNVVGSLARLTASAGDHEPGFLVMEIGP